MSTAGTLSFPSEHVSELADLPVDGVRVWSADLNHISAAELGGLRELLNPSELERAARFHFESDCRHYMAARGLLRSLLGSELNEPAADLVFEYGAHGKPALSSIAERKRAPFFNLSHSGGQAMLALSWKGEVGIDLEATARFDGRNEDLLPLAARILSPRELTIFSHLANPGERRAAFFRAWTRKEACVKAMGLGLLKDVAGIELALDAASPIPCLTYTSPKPDTDTRVWAVCDLPAPDGFAAAIAAEEPQVV